MSGQEQDFITLDDLEEEFTFVERVAQNLGVQDELTAAILANQVRLANFERRQTEFLETLAGETTEITPPDIEVIVEEITPQIDVTTPIDEIEIDPLSIDQDTFADAIRQGAGSLNRVQLYNTEAGTGDILSQSVRPASESSSFRVSITPDTQTSLSLVVDPDDEDEFTEALNQGGDLGADSKREFQFDVDPGAKYNLQLGAAGTVKNLRVQEILVE